MSNCDAEPWFLNAVSASAQLLMGSYENGCSRRYRSSFPAGAPEFEDVASGMFLIKLLFVGMLAPSAALNSDCRLLLFQTDPPVVAAAAG